MLAALARGQTAPDAAEIARVRGNARTYIQQLALLTCTENTTQTVRIARVAWTERREDSCDTKTYQLFAVQALSLARSGVNLKRASSDWRERLKEASLGATTGFLAAIAEPRIAVDFRWQQMGTESGRKVEIFSFRVPAADGYELEETKGTTRVAYKGLVYAHPETGTLARVEIQCVDIPRDSEYEGAEVTVDFGSFDVGGHQIELPSHSMVRFRMKLGAASNEADYSYYRLANFGVDTQIRFYGEAAEERK